mmetsp:Transcript_10052/g.29707  ORF Transcript_10052/g.29707 Transcript_10052/m.29707 type:complete len:275 (-) Transcript_10052:73-897(-)
MRAPGPGRDDRLALDLVGLHQHHVHTQDPGHAEGRRGGLGAPRVRPRLRLARAQVRGSREEQDGPHHRDPLLHELQEHRPAAGAAGAERLRALVPGPGLALLPVPRGRAPLRPAGVLLPEVLPPGAARRAEGAGPRPDRCRHAGGREERQPQAALRRGLQAAKHGLLQPRRAGAEGGREAQARQPRRSGAAHDRPHGLGRERQRGELHGRGEPRDHGAGGAPAAHRQESGARQRLEALAGPLRGAEGLPVAGRRPAGLRAHVDRRSAGELGARL